MESAAKSRGILAAALGPDTLLGPYRVVRQLGSGGMGAVYEAVDDERSTQVAVKLLLDVEPVALHAFKQEFRRVASLHHPNLVQLYELLHTEGTWLFSMERIRGVGFVEHLRGAQAQALGSSARMERVREAVRQLVLGVDALHRASLLHLDLKPANVLVEDGGRVVVLDFGLVRPAAVTAPQFVAGAGTPHYMAPEQLLGQEAGPASDLYAVGLMLYEALVGETPFGSAPWNALTRPADAPPLRPSARGEGIPADLDELCAALLARDPRARPDAATVLSRLGSPRAAPPRERPGDAPGTVTLVGRDAERAVLRGALAEVERGRPVLVRLVGPSGVGKTALAEQFLREAQESSGAVVLSGRCYEWESVPYKGFDPAMDGLCARLAALPARERESLIPPEARPAAVLFPLLSQLFPPPSPERVGEAPAEAPLEQRARAYRALKCLLRALGRERPLILFLDDVQWGDADGARLLLELLSPPDAPRVLAVLASRPGAAEESAFLGELAQARATQGLADEVELQVQPLSLEEGTTLAARLLGPAASPGQALALAREAAGAPFLLERLARLSASDGARGLDDVVRAQLGELGEEARQVLEIVALAGRLPAQDLAFEVSGAGGDRYGLLAALRSAGLVRTRGARGSDAVEPYHDSIREAVVRQLSAAKRVDLHGRLASALESREGSEPEALAHHWQAAGELARARGWVLRAAERASAALAFERAASHYRAALEWSEADAPDRLTLESRLAVSLFNAGRASEAAPVFAAAAQRAAGFEARELRRRAADAWLHGGHVEQGIESLKPLLREVGLAYPSNAGAVLSLVGQILRHLLVGVAPRKGGRAPTEEEAFVLDLAWGAAKVLTNIFPMVGAHLHLQALNRALAVDDPKRQGRSLLLVGTLFHSMGGPLARPGARLFALAEKLANETRDPYLRGLVLVFRGVAEYSGEGRWKLAAAWSDEGVRLFREHCTGVPWEVDMGLMTSLKAADFEGDIASQGERAAEWMREAADRGDLYAQAAVVIWICFRHLAAGRVPEARTSMRRPIARWPRTGYTVQHFHATRTEIFCDLYEGNPHEALARFDADLPQMRKTGLHRLALTRIEMFAAEGLARLGIAAGNPGQRAKQLERASRIAAALEKETRSDGPPLGVFFRASIAALSGDIACARGLLGECESRAEAAGLTLLAHCARRRRAELEGDDAAVAAIDAWFTARGAVEPGRWVSVFAPPVRAA